MIKYYITILMTRLLYKTEVFTYKVDNPGKSMIISITLLMSPMIYLFKYLLEAWDASNKYLNKLFPLSICVSIHFLFLIYLLY